VEILDRVAFLKLSFEWLQHLADDSPVLVATDATGDFRLLDANVRHDGDGFVIVA